MKKRHEELTRQISSRIIEAEKLERSVELLFSFSEHNHTQIRIKLERLTNIALKTIFPDKELIFRVVANKTKKGLYYDLYIETDGVITDLMDAKGGGVMDVIAMCLRISYISLMKSVLRQTILMDEPFKNLDSERVVRASAWLKLVSDSMKIQFLIVTHIPTIIASVDNAIEMHIENGQTMSSRLS